MKNLAALTFLFLLVSQNAMANDARIIEIPGAPLSIMSYEASYQEEERYTREGIRHSVKVKNEGSADVLAYGIGFFAFDAFNHSMGRPLTGIAMNTVPPGKEQSGAWSQRPSAAFTFKWYGTGVAYVRQARLSDGTVWQADMDFVLRELQKIESGLSLEDIVPE